MAGSQFSRVKNQVTILFQTKFDTKTKDGKMRLGLLVVFVLLALLVLSQVVGASSSTGVAKSSASAAKPVPVQTNMFDDDDDGDGDGEGDGDGDSLIDDEDEDGASDGDDEEGEEESSGSKESSKIKAKQVQRLRDDGQELLKFFDKFRQGTEVHSHMLVLQQKYGDLGILQSKAIGKTYEKRDLYVYTLGKGKKNRAMLVIGTEHAAEWTGAMSLAYFATRMVQLYGINEAVTDIMEGLTVYLIPVMNPDGLFYTITSKKAGARYWQKNLEQLKVKGHKVKGGDLQMDWKRFELSESQSVRAFLLNAKKLDAFVSVHCCGGSVIKAFNFSCMNEAAAKEQDEVANAIVKEMSSSAFEFKTVAQIASKSKSKSAEVASKGNSVNWALNDKGMKLAFIIEGRPSLTSKKKLSKTDKRLVELPTTEIMDASREITKGILELGKYVTNRYTRTSIECGASESSGADDDEDAEAGDEGDSEAAGDDYGDGDGDDESSINDNDAGGDDESGEEDSSESSGSDSNDAYDDEEEPGAASGSAAASSAIEDAIESDKGTILAGKMVEKSDFGSVKLPPPDGSGPHALYYAYGADLLYEILLTSGISSAWKVANAKLMNYHFDFAYYSKKVWRSGVADLVKNKHSIVWGTVWRIDKTDIENLDQLNLASSGRFVKMNVTVTDRRGNEYRCFTYRAKVKAGGTDIFNKYRRFSPSRQYRNCVVKGAKQQHLPNQYIEKIRSYSPLFTDKIGKTYHRNSAIGTLCDKQ